MSPLKHLQLATQSHQAPYNLYFKLLKWRNENVATGTGTVKNGAELGAPGDEYNKSPCREGRAGLLEDKTRRPLRPREYYQIPFSHLGAWGRMESGNIPESVVDGEFCLRAIRLSLPCKGTYYTRHQALRAQRHFELSQWQLQRSRFAILAA